MHLVKKWYPTAVWVILGLFVAYIFQDTLTDFVSDMMERGRRAAMGEKEEEKKLALNPTVEVTLFFGSSDGEMLAPLTSKVEKGTDVVQTLRHTLNALVDGPKQDNYTPIVPKGTKLRAIFPGSESTVYVDFDRTFRDGHPGGAWSEMLTAQAVANTVIKNFGDVFERVVLLIEGQEAVTVVGAYAIPGPLRFREDLIAKVAPEASDSPVPETPSAVPGPPSPVGVPAPTASVPNAPKVGDVGVPSPIQKIEPVGGPSESNTDTPEAGASKSPNPKP